MEGKMVRICPKCGADNIKETGPAAYEKSYQLSVQCADCGFSSPSFPVFPEGEVEKVQEGIRKEKKK